MLNATDDHPDVAPAPPAPRRVTLTSPLARIRAHRRGTVSFADVAPEPPPPKPEPVRRPAKVARLLALAHHIEAAIAAGTYRDRADAARQLGVSRPRISQIMDLALLAPDLQEAILFMEAVDGVEPLWERRLRGIVGDGEWEGQRGRWAGHMSWAAT